MMIQNSMRMSHFQLAVVGAIALAIMIMMPTAKAATGTWNVNGSGNWTTSGNWSGGVPSAAGDVASLTNDLTAAAFINLDASETIGILNIGDPTSSYYSFSLTNSANTLTFNNNGNGAAIRQTTSGSGPDTNAVPITLADDLTVTNLNTLMLSGVIGGSKSLTKVGSGTLIVSNVNAYSGGTTCRVGTLNVLNSYALGSGNLAMAGGTLAGFGVTLTNAVVAQGGSTSTIQLSGAGGLTLNGNLSGGGSINAQYGGGSGTQTIALGGDNSGYTGTFTEANNGSVRYSFATASSGSSNALWVLNNSSPANNSGHTFGFSGSTICFGALSGNGGIRGGVTINIGGLNANATWSGNISANAGVINVIKSGTNSETFTAAQGYTGTTTVQDGSLIAGNNAPSGAVGAFGNATSVIALGDATTISSATAMNPAVLIGGAYTIARAVTVGANNNSLGNASTTFTLGGSTVNSSTFSGNITLNQSCIVTQAAGGALTISGIISGSGGLAKTGDGAVTNSGANTYTGVTTLNGGVFNAGIAQNGTTSGPLGASGNIVFGGGTLQFSSASAAWDPSARIAAGTSASPVAIDVNGQSVTLVTALNASQSGGLALTNSTSGGSLTLSANNSYGGTTTVNNGGTLKLGHANALGSTAAGTTINGGGTLDLNGFAPPAAESISVTGGGVSGAGALINSGAAVSLSQILQNSTSFTIGGSGDITLNGVSGQSGQTLTKTGSGAVTLAGTNPYLFGANNGTLVISNGTLVAAFSSSSGSAHIADSATISGGTLKFDPSIGTVTGSSPYLWGGQINGAITMNSGTLDLNGASGQNSRIQQLVGAGGTILNNSAIPAVLSIAARDSNTLRTFSGTIQDGVGTVSLDFTSIGTTGSGRTNVLAGSNTFSGPTTNSFGTLQLGNANALQNSTLVLGAPLAFSAGIGTFTLGGLSGSQNIVLIDAGSSAVKVGIGNNGASTTYSGVMSGSGGVTKIGSGALVLTGANSYSGATTVSNGMLVVYNTLASSAVTNVGGTTLLVTNTTFSGSLALLGNSVLSMTNGVAGGTLSVVGLTLDDGNVLNFDVGATADKIAMTGGTYTKNAGTVTINIATNGALVAGTYDLITASGLTSTNGFVLGTPRLVDGYPLTLVAASGKLQLLVAARSAWWKGDVNGNWNTANPSYNWNVEQGSGINASYYPDATMDVYFTADGANNLETTLGQDFAVKSLSFLAASGVTITGANGLTLSNGITVASGAGNNTISPSKMVVADNQTWSNASANVLTVNAVVTNTAASGVKNLSITGTGNVNLGGAVASGPGAIALLKTGAGTLTMSGGGTFTQTGASGFSIDFREGTAVLGAGTYAVTGEPVVGDNVAAGGTGYDTTLIMTNNAALTASTYFSHARGNGVGGVSSDVILSNNASITAASFASGYNAGNAANKPKGSIILNDNTLFTVTGNTAFNLAESAGSDITLTLNNAAQLNAAGTAIKYLGMYGKGTLNVMGSSSVGFGNAVAYVGYKTGTGTVNVVGGSFNCAGELRVGGSDINGTGYNATGTVIVTSGSIGLGALTLARGNNYQNGCSGTVIVNGGTVTSTSDVMVAYAGAGAARLAIGGGTLNVGATSAKWLYMSDWDTARGQMDITSGALNLMANSCIKFSAGGTGTVTSNVVNQSGGTVTFYSDNGITIGGTGDLDLQKSGASTCTNIYNLDGGTLIVPAVVSTLATATRTFNFNGGTLMAAKDNTSFFNLGSGNARANIRNGGAVLDSNGKNVTLSQALRHSNIADDAVTDGGLTKNGAGTLTLSGANDFTGATTLNLGTLMLSGSGTLGSGANALNVVNGTLDLGGLATPAAGAVTLTGGTIQNGTLTASTSFTVNNNAAVTLNAKLAGAVALVKSGAGTLTLTSNNTYSAGTTVNNGALIVNGSIAGTALLAAGTSLSGTGSVAGVVTANNAACINLTNGVAETLTVGGLSLDSGSVLTFDVGSAADKIVVSGGSVGVTGTVTIHINAISGFGFGSYTLIQGGVSDVSGFALTGLTAPHGQSYTLVKNGSDLQLVIAYTIPPTAYWTGTGDNLWTGTANWATNKAGTQSLGLVPGDVSAVIMTATGAGNPGTMLGSDFTIDTLTFDNASAVGLGGANTLTINSGLVVSNGAAAATISNGTVVALGGSQTWTHNGADALTVNGAISGSVKALTKAGSGTLILAGTNTYGGGTTVSNGLVVLNNTNSVGTGLLTLAGGTVSNSAALGLTNAVALANSSILNVANALALGGVISGAGGLTKSGAATLTLVGATNSYAGGTTISAGTLALGADYGANENGYALGSGPVTVGSGAQLRFGGAGGAAQNFTITNAISLNGGSLYVVDGAQYLTGALTVNSNTACYGNWRTKSMVLAGAMSGPGAIMFADDRWDVGEYAELHVANPDNTYTGAITINNNNNGAQLSVDTNNALANAMVTIGGFSETTGLVFGVNAPVPVLGALSGTGKVSVAGASLNVGNNNANSAFFGNISGAGSLTKIGSGTLTLSGTNTYSGTTMVSAGKLVVNGKMPTNSLTVAANAALAGTGTVYGAVILQAGAAALSLTNGVGGTLTLTNGLTLDNGNHLDFDLGTASDKIAVSAGSFTKNAGTVTINLAKLTGYLAGTNDLIVASGLTSASGFVLGTVPSGYGWTLIADPSGKLQVVATNESAQAAFWRGSSDANWETLENWATDLSGATTASMPPGEISQVTFTTTNAANLDTIMNADLAIDRLIVNSNGLPPSSISGPGALTLMSGLVMSNGASSMAISNGLTLGNSQVWSNSSTAGTVIVAHAISGSGKALQVTGSGRFRFTEPSTYDGGTTVSNATLELRHATDTLPDTAPVTINGGTLDLGANQDTVGAVTLVSGTLTNTTGSLAGSSYTVQSGTVAATLAGSGAMTKAVTGTVSITRTNTYSGGTTVSAGTLSVQASHALGTGVITLNGGAIEDPVNVLLTNAVVAQAGSTSTLRVSANSNGNDFQVNGNLSGSGNINLDASGSGYVGVKLGGDNSGLSGVVTLGGGSQARHKFTAATAGSSNACWNWTTSATDCGSPAFGSGTIYFGAIAGVGVLRANGGGSPVMEVGALNTNTTWSGNIGQDGLAINIRKVGAGTLTLASGNNSPGYVEIQGGTIAYGANNTLSDSSSVKINGGTLSLSSYNDTVGGVQLVSGAITGAGGTLTSSSHYILESGSVSAILGGTKAVYKTNTGVVALSGVNTFSGGTTNANGTLAINVPGALSTGSLVLTGGALDNTSGSNVTVSTGNYQVWDADVAFTGTTNLNLGAGTVKLSANRNVTVSANTLTVGGAVTGAYALVKSGPGTLVLAGGASTYSGGTTVSNGVLKLAAANALGQTTNTLAVTAGAVDLNGYGLGIGSLGLGTITGTILNNGESLATLTVGNNNASSVSLTTLADGTAPLAVIKIGTGAWTIGNSNSFSGGFALYGGTLYVTNSYALGAGALTLTNGTLDNGGAAVVLANAILVPPGANGVINESGAVSYDVNGNISGSGNVTVSFSGSNPNGVRLGGNNSGFTGKFTMTGTGNARHKFAAATAGSSNAWWALDCSATDCGSLSFANGTIYFGALSGNANMRNGGNDVIEVGGLNTNSTWSGNITAIGGSVSLRKVGIGTLTIAAANGYSGSTTVSNGTLEVNGSIAGSGTTVKAGAKLAGSGTISSLVTLEAGNAAISLTNNTAATLTLAGGLTLNNGNVLNFDLGATAASDKVAMTGGSYTKSAGTVTINVAVISGFGVGAYDLITGLGISDASGFAVGPMPAGYFGRLSANSGTLQLEVRELTGTVFSYR